MTTSDVSDATTVDGRPELVADGNFVKAGGVVSMVAPFVFVGALLSGTDLANNTFDALGHLMYIVVVLVLYHLFRDGGATIRLAAVMGVVGLLFITLTDFLGLAGVELAAQSAAAGTTTPAIDAVGETVLVLRSHFSTVGNALAWGVGGGLFSLAMLRTNRVSNWLGWAGLLFAVLMWASLFDVMFTPGGIRESPVFFLGNFFGRFWLVALGVALVRIDTESIP
jgi:hypothetical protein